MAQVLLIKNCSLYYNTLSAIKAEKDPLRIISNCKCFINHNTVCVRCCRVFHSNVTLKKGFWRQFRAKLFSSVPKTTATLELKVCKGHVRETFTKQVIFIKSKTMLANVFTSCPI